MQAPVDGVIDPVAADHLRLRRFSETCIPPRKLSINSAVRLSFGPDSQNPERDGCATMVCYFTRLKKFHKLCEPCLMLVTLFRLLSRLPLPLLHATGAALGRLVYAVSATYRSRLKENIARAGYAQLAQAAAAEAGKNVLELPFVWFASQERLLKVAVLEDWDLIERTMAEGKGVIFLTPHLGCFEVTAQLVATRTPITVLYRPPKKAVLKPLLEGARARNMLSLAPANLSGVRSLLKTLRRGGAVGLLPDQVPQQGEGVWADFFGKPAYTMTLPARLQQLSGAPVLVAYGLRVRGGFRVRIARLEGALDGSPHQQARAVNAAMERLIAHCPEQYLWSYNRYKVPAGVTPPPAPKGVT
jgi:Kdo2-lipid IVA lauroyltransferase/acyltransferase